MWTNSALRITRVLVSQRMWERVAREMGWDLMFFKPSFYWTLWAATSTLWVLSSLCFTNPRDTCKSRAFTSTVGEVGEGVRVRSRNNFCFLLVEEVRDDDKCGTRPNGFALTATCRVPYKYLTLYCNHKRNISSYKCICYLDYASQGRSMEMNTKD